MPPPKIVQDPTLPKGFSSTFRQRFWSKIRKTDSCWEWTAAKSPHGYGVIGIGGRFGRNILASRAMWIIVHGSIPNDFDVLHKCDNPACVNPDHLFVGTHFDNMADMISKGRSRHPVGENAPCVKLTSEKVIQIRKMWKLKEMNQHAIARHFGVSHGAVSHILLNLTWKHLINLEDSQLALPY